MSTSRPVSMRLSFMMFLQYAVWGVWLPIVARYLQAPIADGGLGFSPDQVGWIAGFGGSVGALTAPWIAGQFADRYFATEKFLAVLLAVGGVVKIITAYQTSFGAWMVLSAVYSLLFMPTLALSNSLAFSHLEDGKKEFPLVRVWGTIGWIAASWLFPLFWLLQDVRLQALPPFYGGTEVAGVTGRLADALIVSGVVSVLYAAYCLTLPHTPPKRDAVESLAFRKAFGLLRRRSFLVLVLASLPIAIIHQVYFIQTGPFFGDVLGLKDSQIGPAMTIGQFAEIAVMVLTGWLLQRLGFRWVLTLGGLAYFVRYAIFASAEFLPVPVVVSSQLLHGICYACFFAAAFIYVDRIADADIRHSAQTVFGIIILGLGPVLSSTFLAWMVRVLPESRYAIDYSGLWWTVALIGLGAAVIVATFFRDETAGSDTV